MKPDPRKAVATQVNKPSSLASLGLTAILSCGLLSSCGTLGSFVEYTDGLRNSQEHPVVVRGISQVGGFLGLLASVPVTVVALGFTYPSYLASEAASGSENTDLASTLLMPSFAMLEMGSLLGAPADLVHFLISRVWDEEVQMDPSEREAFENELDEDTLPRYPVKPILPVIRK